MPQRLPPLRPSRIIRALEKCGLVVDHQTGSHVILYREGLRRPVAIANHNEDVLPGVLRKILRQAEVSEEEFLAKV